MIRRQGLAALQSKVIYRFDRVQPWIGSEIVTKLELYVWQPLNIIVWDRITVPLLQSHFTHMVML